MAQEDAVGLVVKAVGNGRVGLQQHPDAQTVEIDTCHRRHLRLVVGLTLDDRGDNAHLLLGKTELLRFGDILRCPEGIVCILLLLKDLFH